MTATSGADLCGWLQYGPVVLLQTWPLVEGLRARALWFSGSGSNPDSITYWDLSQLNISKPKFSYPGTASPP